MRHVIIGGSAAGINAAEVIRRNDKAADITLISDESLALYSRCLLTYLISGAIDEAQLHFKSADFFKRNNIKTYLGKKADSIDRKNKKVALEDGTDLAYDKLLIATGASPRMVNIPGVDKPGVFPVRYIDNARDIIKRLDKVNKVAVFGGGLIGLKDAYALRKKDITVVVKSPHVLSQMLDKDAADMISKRFQDNGIKIMTGVDPKAITGKSEVEAVELDNGKSLDCQLIIVGKGVDPNTSLGASCGLKIEDAIVVDKFLRTSDPDIFAAGDVAQTYDIARESERVNALWPCAVEQGEYAGLNMAGKETVYEGSLSMNSMDCFGLGSISIGITKLKDDAGYEVLLSKRERSYRKFILKKNRIVGMVMVGDIGSAGIANILIRKRIDVSSIKNILLKESFDYAKIMPLVAKEKDRFVQEEYQDTILSY